MAAMLTVLEAGEEVAGGRSQSMSPFANCHQISYSTMTTVLQGGTRVPLAGRD